MEICKEEFMLREEIKAKREKSQLFSRIQNTVIQFISVREQQLQLYKEVGNKKLIDLAATELLELKADLKQLKNL